MADQLWEQAKALADRGYRVSFEVDELPDGQLVYMARNPDLPGCKAQGASIDEAKANLDEVRIDYINALLEENLPVPQPTQPVVDPISEMGHPDNVTIRTFIFGANQEADMNYELIYVER
jgi:predicted RNase H-like HicB family nuclease